VKVALKKVGISFSGELPAEASLRLPYIQMDGSNIVRDGNKIRSSDKDGFADFSFDLDRIASTVFPQIPPMTINAELDLVIGSIETSVTAIDVDFNPTMNLTQTAEVAANGVNINFDFGRTVTAGVLNADGSVAVAQAPRSSLTLDAGQKLSVVYDGSDLNLTPTFTVDAALKSQFGLSISSEIAFRALLASMEAKLFGFELGGFSIRRIKRAFSFRMYLLATCLTRLFHCRGSTRWWVGRSSYRTKRLSTSALILVSG
jgi:hypothetical protein